MIRSFADGAAFLGFVTCAEEIGFHNFLGLDLRVTLHSIGVCVTLRALDCRSGTRRLNGA